MAFLKDVLNEVELRTLLKCHF